MRKPDPNRVPPRVITVRISPEDYASVQAWAQHEGYSLNHFCLEAILARRDAVRQNGLRAAFPLASDAKTGG